MAIACGVVVANMYYVQPIGNLVAQSFHISVGQVGAVSTVTQFGYALGLLFLVPLGDVVSRYKLIIRMALLSSLSLLAAFFAPNFMSFITVSFLIGLLSIIPQIIIPYGAVLAGTERRGQVMGTLLGGLLIGILVSRTFSGILSNYIPWRYVYLIAVLMILILVAFLSKMLPKDQPIHQRNYLDAVRSMPGLVKKQPVLRESAINGFLMFGTFSIFWSTLVFYIAAQYHQGSGMVGLLALLGAGGALAAPIIGRFADEMAPRKIVGIGLVLQTLSFLLLLVLGQHLAALIVAIILLDVGNQCGQVANQTRVQNLGEAVSNRNNTVFMFSYFIGGASGSLLGTLAWEHAAWFGVCLLALGYQVVGLLLHYLVYQER
ncbi:MFS transporter [Agrilactobacillus fermenti]|uniref:MFS transporter n=1 Tax=Agrilactobacillus fermenti TaxID=2586909 RepID=UPI003A5C49F2